MAALPPAHSLIKAGTLRALALTGEQRWHDLPDVPTMIELGYEGFVSETFQGLLAPAGTPQPIVDRLYREYTAAAGLPEEGVHGLAAQLIGRRDAAPAAAPDAACATTAARLVRLVRPVGAA